MITSRLSKLSADKFNSNLAPSVALPSFNSSGADGIKTLTVYQNMHVDVCVYVSE